MTVLDEAVVTPEMVAQTAKTIEGMTQNEVAEVAEVAEPMTISERLKTVYETTVPAQLDHSTCQHEATNSARRRCRREKLAAAQAAQKDGMGLHTQHAGEDYVSSSAVRANLLSLITHRQLGREAVNEMFSLLGMPETEMHPHRRQQDVTFKVEIVLPHAAITGYSQSDINYRMRSLRDWYSLTCELDRIDRRYLKTRNRTVIEYDGEVEVGRTKEEINYITGKIKGTYTFDPGQEKTAEMMTAALQQFIQTWVQQAWDRGITVTVLAEDNNFAELTEHNEDEDLALVFTEILPRLKESVGAAA